MCAILVYYAIADDDRHLRCVIDRISISVSKILASKLAVERESGSEVEQVLEILP